VFNTLGQQVATLVQGDQEVGYHEVRFDGSNLASGLYFYRLEAGAYVETRKHLMIRNQEPAGGGEFGGRRPPAPARNSDIGDPRPGSTDGAIRAVTGGSAR
jgi:hypothetical protein